VAVAGDGHVEIPADVAGLEDASDRPGLRVDRIEAVMAGDEDLAHLDDGGERGEGKQDRADEGKPRSCAPGMVTSGSDPGLCGSGAWPRFSPAGYQTGVERVACKSDAVERKLVVETRHSRRFCATRVQLSRTPVTNSTISRAPI
jgi:hypothetical protein